MRLAVIADIHGNFRALEAVLADIALMRADRIVSLGDNIGYGPEPEEVVQALIAIQAESVMGNHELGLVSRSYRNKLNYVARESLEISRRLLSAESLAWLENLPAAFQSCDARFVHGCPPHSMTVYLLAPSDNRLRRLFASYPECLCFAGHTHDFGFFELRGDEIHRRALQIERLSLDCRNRYLVLPGSVGQPRDRFSGQAKYMFWDKTAQILEVRSVPYDVDTTVRLLAERHFPPSNARRLLRGGISPNP